MNSLLPLSEYQTFIFDCDGVLLDSNQIKSEAFYQVATKFGTDTAEQFLAYHKANGGISRFKKFEHLVSAILRGTHPEAIVPKLVEEYGNLVKSKLITCPECPGAIAFLERLPATSKAFVVSGGFHDELLETFSSKQLDIYFDGIHGSPRTKPEILTELSANGSLKYPAIFFGDSRADYDAARQFNCDFMFLHGCTEMQDWKAFVNEHSLPTTESFHTLIHRRDTELFPL